MNKLDQQLNDFMLSKLGGEFNVSRLRMAAMIAEFERDGTPIGRAIEILLEKKLFGMFKLLNLDELLEILTGEGEGDLDAALARLDAREPPSVKTSEIPTAKPASRPPVPAALPSTDDVAPQVINRTHVENSIIEFVE